VLILMRPFCEAPTAKVPVYALPLASKDPISRQLLSVVFAGDARLPELLPHW
jgi:hypothetical protein